MSIPFCHPQCWDSWVRCRRGSCQNLVALGFTSRPRGAVLCVIAKRRMCLLFDIFSTMLSREGGRFCGSAPSSNLYTEGTKNGADVWTTWTWVPHVCWQHTHKRDDHASTGSRAILCRMGAGRATQGKTASSLLLYGFDLRSWERRKSAAAAASRCLSKAQIPKWKRVADKRESFAPNTREIRKIILKKLDTEN